MDDPKAVILDISSDEEEGSVETNGVGLDGGGKYGHDWLARLLDEAEGPASDSDDVVVVGEVISSTKQTVKSSSTDFKDSVKAVDDEDGDCVILEEDPDKPVDVNNDDERGEDSDDLLVVSEKGQVACRDYPHPRHHCAKFPFASTPHKSYCDQCHCYVCDSIAPCGYWGNGMSNIDHCHATDKDEFWKDERQNRKMNNNVVIAVPSVVGGALSVQPPVLNQSPQPQLVSLNVTQNRAFAQGPIRPCSMTASLGRTNITSQQGTQPPGFIDPIRLPGYSVPRNTFQDHVISYQLRNGYGNRSSNGGRWNASQVGPQHFQSHTLFKRSGSAAQPLTSPRHGNSSYRVYHRSLFHTNPPLGPRPVDFHDWGTAPITNASQLSVRPRLEIEPVIYLPSGPQSFSQPLVNAAGPVPSESQVYSPSSNYAIPGLEGTHTDYYSVPSESQSFFQGYIGSNSMDTAPLHEHPNGLNNFENPIHPRSRLAYQAKGGYYNSLAQLDLQSNGCKGFVEVTVDSQSVVSVGPHMASSCGNANQLESPALHISLDDSQNIYNRGNQTENGGGPDIAPFGFDSEGPLRCENTIQLESSAPCISVDDIQNVCHPGNQTRNADESEIVHFGFDQEGTFCEPQNAESAEKSLFAAPETNNQLAENSSPSALNLGYDNWFFEDPVVPGLNACSPEAAPVDSWPLF